MGQTTNYNIPYPDIDDPRNITEDMKNMANATDTAIKEVENNINKKNNILAICGSGDKTYNIETAYERKKITFDSIKSQIGNLLSLNNNSIKVGKDVNHLKISGLFGLWTSASSSVEIQIYKNESMVQNVYWNKTIKTDTNCFVLPTLLLSVKEGDLISLRFTSGTTGSYKVFERADVSYLQAEVID